MHQPAHGFEVTVCVTPDEGAAADARLHEFEAALRTQLDSLEQACGSAIVSLAWSEPQHAYRRFEISFSHACNASAVAFAVDAAAVASAAAVPDGVIVIKPSGETVPLSAEVDRPCDIAPD
jgi:hypothetical protein